MNDQDEMFERATETPASLGCPALGPKQLPGGFDGTEPGKVREEARTKIKACNDRSRARLQEVLSIAEKVLFKTVHSDGYKPGQYGQDYRDLGKAICEIRKIIRDSVTDVDPDYEMLALQFARNSFDFSKFQEAMVAVASMKETDFPGYYYTPGWLCELAKKLEGNDKPIDPTAPEIKRGKDAKQEAFNRRTWSFCDGLFPIIHIDTQEGFMARCKINGRLFKESVTQEDGADGPVWTGYIYDKGACVCMVGSMGKGKTATKLMTHAAFMAYVKQLSGGGAKYHNRKGFLRQHAARVRAAAKQQAHDNKEGK